VPDPRHELGRRAEDAAARWLISLGWTILATRWRSPSGELDLVCTSPDGTLVGVEVKLRSTGRAGSALEALDRRRLARLRRTLLDYGREATEAWAARRIDLITATPAAGRWRLVRMAGVDAW
jgi:putative endonuclease